MPSFPGAGVIQSAKHVEQLPIFQGIVEWSRKIYGVGGVELFFRVEVFPNWP